MNSVASLILIAVLGVVDPNLPGTRPDDSPSRSSEPEIRIVDSRITLEGLPPILQRPEVREALDSGLTATLLAEVRVEEGRRNRCVANFAARSRLDLWDEQYLVAWTDGKAAPQSEHFDSIEALHRWWQSAELSCSLLSPPTNPPQAELIVRVVPFSREEEVDARGWFQQSEVQPTASRDGQGSSLLELLLASAIRREATLTFTWKIGGIP